MRAVFVVVVVVFVSAATIRPLARPNAPARISIFECDMQRNACENGMWNCGIVDASGEP